MSSLEMSRSVGCASPSTFDGIMDAFSPNQSGRSGLRGRLSPTPSPLLEERTGCKKQVARKPSEDATTSALSTLSA